MKGVIEEDIQKIQKKQIRPLPELEITSPQEGETVSAGSTLRIEVRVSSDSQVIALEFLVNGESQEVVNNPVGLVISEFQTPLKVDSFFDSLEIEVIAKDLFGQTTTVTRKLEVASDSPPKVSITSPSEGGSVIAILGILIAVKAEDDFGVSSVEGTLTYEGGSTQIKFEQSPNDVPVMVWRATGNVPSGVSSVVIEVTATDTVGQTATATRKITIASDSPPKLSITSPGEGESVIAVLGILIAVEAEDDFGVSRVEGTLTYDCGSTQIIFEQSTGDGQKGLWQAKGEVPEGVSSVVIEVTATDNTGNKTTATRKLEVVGAAPPKVSIVSPVDGAKVAEGSSFDVRVQASGQSKIVGVGIFMPGVGATSQAKFVDGFWVSTLIAPTFSSTQGVISGNAIPHVFVGDVTIGGSPATDGTEVIAWVAGGPAVNFELEATATDDSGQQNKDAIRIAVLPGRLRVASTTVQDGMYSLQVGQFQGQSFAGRQVTFTINGQDAPETKTWKAGEGDILILSLLGD